MSITTKLLTRVGASLGPTGVIVPAGNPLVLAVAVTTTDVVVRAIRLLVTVIPRNLLNRPPGVPSELSS